MREVELSRVSLVQACEETDPDDRFLTRGERAAAGRQAAKDASPEESDGGAGWIRSRAKLLAARLIGDYPALGRGQALSRLPIPAAVAIAAGLLLGLGIDALGSLRKINLLSFPLIGLVGWNLAVYLGGLLRLPRHDDGRGPRAWSALAMRLSRARGGGTEGAAGWQARALRRYWELWLQRAGTWLGARLARLLHTAAAATSVGVICGMYFSGFAFEFRATWESTFLDAPAVHRLLSTLLAPASMLLRLPIPSAAEVAAVQAPADGDAAVWIHLWTVTTALAVLLPRVGLAFAMAVRERRAAGALAFDLESPYALLLLAPTRGGHTEVEVQAYSYRPSAASLERQRELCLELFGNRARLDFRPPVPYGTELPGTELTEEAQTCRVLVFNVAQSPEQEVHGEIIEELKRWAESRKGSHRLLILLDEEPHLRGLDTTGAEEVHHRHAQRVRNWQRVVRSCELVPCVLPGEGHIASAIIQEASEGLWPASRSAEAKA